MGGGGEEEEGEGEKGRGEMVVEMLCEMLRMYWGCYRASYLVRFFVLFCFFVFVSFCFIFLSFC